MDGGGGMTSSGIQTPSERHAKRSDAQSAFRNFSPQLRDTLWEAEGLSFKKLRAAPACCCLLSAGARVPGAAGSWTSCHPGHSGKISRSCVSSKTSDWRIRQGEFVCLNQSPRRAFGGLGYDANGRAEAFLVCCRPILAILRKRQ
jgi:hypothetical protein